MFRRIATVFTRFVTLAAALPSLALAQGPSMAVPGAGARLIKDARAEPVSIVLVHGAFANGSGWGKLIPLLEKDGHRVIAVQNAMSSVAADVDNTKRVIESQPGPVVVVAHSYGGAVMTGAAAGISKVKALVYVAAFAPDAGEPLGAFLEKYPSALAPALRPDAGGFVYIDREQFRNVFAGDVPSAEARLMSITQVPIHGAAFAASVPNAAWRTIPSWFLIAQQDRTLNPDMLRFYAKRMGAKVTEIKSSHVAFLSHPTDVARIIGEAARSTPR